MRVRGGTRPTSRDVSARRRFTYLIVRHRHLYTSCTHERLGLCLVSVQNLVKRDKEGYRDEFLQQQRNYLSELEIFKLKVRVFIKPSTTGRWFDWLRDTKESLLLGA